MTPWCSSKITSTQDIVNNLMMKLEVLYLMLIGLLPGRRKIRKNTILIIVTYITLKRYN